MVFVGIVYNYNVQPLQHSNRNRLQYSCIFGKGCLKVNVYLQLNSCLHHVQIQEVFYVWHIFYIPYIFIYLNNFFKHIL